MKKTKASAISWARRPGGSIRTAGRKPTRQAKAITMVSATSLGSPNRIILRRHDGSVGRRWRPRLTTVRRCDAAIHLVLRVGHTGGEEVGQPCTGDGSHEPVVDPPFVAIAYDVEVRVAQEEIALDLTGHSLSGDRMRGREMHGDLVGRPVDNLL